MVKRKFFGVKLSGEELDTLERIKNSMGYRTKSDALRSALRVVDVLYDDRLVINKAIKPKLLKHVIGNNDFRDTVPLCDILKTVPQLEEVVNKL